MNFPFSDHALKCGPFRYDTSHTRHRSRADIRQLADLDNLPTGAGVSEAALNVSPPEQVAKCIASGTGMEKAGLFPDDTLEQMERTLEKHKEESRRFAETLSEIKAEDPPKEVKEKEGEAAVDTQSEQSSRMPFINKPLTGGQSEVSCGSPIEDTWSRHTFLSSQRPVNEEDTVQAKPKDKIESQNNDASRASTSQPQTKPGPLLKVSRLSALILQRSRGVIPDDHPELVNLAKKFAAKCIEASPEWIHEIVRTEAGRQNKILDLMNVMGLCVADNDTEEWERLHRHLTISFEWGKTRNELMRKYGAPTEELNVKIREAFAGMTDEEMQNKYPGIRSIPFLGESAADEALEGLVGLGGDLKAAAVLFNAQIAAKSASKTPKVAEGTQRGPAAGAAPTDLQRRVRRAVKAVMKSEAGGSRATSSKAEASQTKTATAQPAVKYVAGTPEHLQAVEEELWRAATERPLLSPSEFSLVFKQASTWGLSAATLREAEETYQDSLSGMMDTVIQRLTPSQQAEMVKFGNGEPGAVSKSTLEAVRAIIKDVAPMETEGTQAATKAEPPTPVQDTAPQLGISRMVPRDFFRSVPLHDQFFLDARSYYTLPFSRWDAESLDLKFFDTMRYLKLKEHVNHARWELEMDATRRIAMAKNRMTSAGVPGGW
ncbi:hypothetical protein W97_08612 [Coniosporium apollinis CBS 100218]|uniref:Uncharacterized protein n=1 Tax=Coniosporium apollinis (strain CBS 100218) TaxID=1168221 RepID=R7Z5A1_CONA1|nr:uncharacterized protein W97_08612 [Coniosporium apollinis CBS 100218]EON69352.1 hypothetical protein W97_08612 [Coniosporium apollinis CBS 100218]